MMTCPVCRQPNGCAMTDASAPKDCWCFSINIPQQLLERVPTSLQGKACICLSCVQQALAEEAETKQKR